MTNERRTVVRDEPRFIVHEHCGYLIGPDGEHLNERRFGRPLTTFYVLDTAYLCEVVATFENPPRSKWGPGSWTQSLAYLRRKAERRARQLNEAYS